MANYLKMDRWEELKVFQAIEAGRNCQNCQINFINCLNNNFNQMDSGIGESLIQQPHNKYRSENFVFKVVLNICLSAAAAGYMLAYLNTIPFDDTVEIFSIQQDRALMQGLLSFCVPAGAAFGGLVFSYVVQHYSRKQCNLIVAYTGIISSLLLLSGNVLVIMGCRLVQGITVGMGFVLRSLYIKEFSPIELAGKMGSMNQLMFSAGLIYTFLQTYLLSLITTPKVYWPIVYALPILIFGVQIYNIQVHYPFETIKYLLEHHRSQEAQELARIVYYDQYAQERIDQLQKFIDLAQNSNPQQIQLRSQGIDHEEATLTKRKAKNNQYAVWTAHHLLILQQATGIQITMIYAGDVILRIYPSIEKTLPILLQALGLYASFLAIELLQSYGRKQIIQKGTAALATLNVIFFACFFWKGEVEIAAGDVSLLPSLIIILGFVAVRMIFSMTLGPVCWIYLAEIVEPDIIGISTMFNWLTAALISLAFPIVVEAFGGPQWLFCLLGVLMWVSYFINDRFMIETKGKPEWQIRQLYDQLLAAAK